MTAFVWKDEYSVGVSEMDATHREFVELVGTLSAAGPDVFSKLFAELLDHTRVHFAHESELMRVSGFPPTPIHEGEHQRVLSGFEAAAERLRMDDPVPALELVQQLPNWFALHAATMDRALGLHLQQSGVSSVVPASP